MITPRLLVTVGFGALSSIVALVVARELLRRPREGEARRAVRMFALFWIGLAADTTINGLTWLAGATGFDSPLVTSVLTYIAILAIVVMVSGIVYYLAYLFTGRPALFKPILAFYALSFVGFLVLVAWMSPIGVTMGQWQGEIAYAHTPHPLAALGVAVFFLLPPIIGALAYGTLALRVKDTADRYRILAVSLGIFVWFGASIAWTGAKASGDAASVIGKLLSIACMLLILSAYFQPAWLARRIGVHEPIAAGSWSEDSRRRARDARRAELAGRVRDLV